MTALRESTPPPADAPVSAPLSVPALGANLPAFVIRPHRGLVAIDLAELWAYRELLWTLVWRELKVRYKQTAIGAAWAIVQPAFSMVLFAIVFGRLAHLPSDGAPYALFSYAALVPWQFFSRALTEASMSLIAQDRLVTKVYFPRMMVPSAVVLSGIADLAIALLLALGLMLYYGYPPGPSFAALPLFVLLAVIAASGISLWLAALNVEYRDVRYVLPFLTQLWLYATPVVYPMSLIPQKWRLLASFNPMCGVVEGFRWAILGAPSPDRAGLAVSLAVSLVLLISGAAYFRRVERTMADRI
jgi:lipopolysaccharide transport system permease protein